MSTTNVTALFLVAALSGLSAACAGNAQDDSEVGEDNLSIPAPTNVAPGKFVLTRELSGPGDGFATSLDIAAEPGQAPTATLERSCLACAGDGLEGEPVVAGVPGFPFSETRVYTITSASVTTCGRIYRGDANLGGASVTIYDYRDAFGPGGAACPAMIASELYVEEVINGAPSTWYGKPWGNPANEIFPNDATKLVAHTAGGGFTPPPPPGAQCAIRAAPNELDVATRRVKWETCQFAGWDKPLTPARGERTLTRAEHDRVVAAAKGVKISSQHICGADKPLLTITVATPSREVTYKDSFYACTGAGPFVDNIDGVFGAFRAVLGQ